MEKIIAVRFKEAGYGYTSTKTKTYHYLTDIEGLKKGDIVVVDSPNSGFVCVEVVSTETDEIAVKNASKWVVCKVDVDGYKARAEREAKRKTLIAQLHKMQSKMLAETQFAALAQISPEAAALVEELKSL